VTQLVRDVRGGEAQRRADHHDDGPVPSVRPPAAKGTRDKAARPASTEMELACRCTTSLWSVAPREQAMPIPDARDAEGPRRLRCSTHRGVAR